MTLGQRLKMLRGKRTQQEIANQLGIARSRYSHYENDYVQVDFELLQKIADLHNVSIDFLLGREVAITENTLSKEEVEVIEDLRRLEEKDKEYVIELIKRLDGQK